MTEEGQDVTLTEVDIITYVTYLWQQYNKDECIMTQPFKQTVLSPSLACA